jgi:hypothetical protein
MGLSYSAPEWLSPSPPPRESAKPIKMTSS